MSLESFERTNKRSNLGNPKLLEEVTKEGLVSRPSERLNDHALEFVQGQEPKKKLTEEQEKAIDKLVAQQKDKLTADEQKQLRGALVAYATGDVTGLYSLIPNADGYSPKVTDAFKSVLEQGGFKVSFKGSENTDPKNGRVYGDLEIVGNRATGLRMRVDLDSEKNPRYRVQPLQAGNPAATMTYDRKGPISYSTERGLTQKWNDSSPDAQAVKKLVNEKVDNEAEFFRLLLR